MLITWFRERRQWLVKIGSRVRPWRQVPWVLIAELTAISVWAIWVGRDLLDFNPFTNAFGREFGAQIEAHFFWLQLSQCGPCALWNGSINGGAPALADAFSSTLHPVVAIPTLLWGMVNGAKVALVLALWMAGLAQWWLGRTLGVGPVARTWSAGIAIVGGHLAGRMDEGAFALVISAAACSLALAAAVDLGVTGQRRSAVRLALFGALAIISGQGYLQLVLLSWAPALLFFILDENWRPRPLWREYALALGLSVLLAGVFLVPVLHFSPNISKATDPQFSTAQPLEYAPLNLVIRDIEFMKASILGKQPFPSQYILYIGWVPVLLAMLSLRFVRRKDHATFLCLTTGTALTFLMTSAIPLRWVVGYIPRLAGFRFTPFMASLAVPPILALAAYGLDGLLGLDWPGITLRPRTSASKQGLSVSLIWILAIPLFWGLRSAQEFSHFFLQTVDVTNVYELTEGLSLPSLQWVAPPFGEHFWVEPTVGRGIKLTSVVWSLEWSGRKAPEPGIVIGGQEAPPGAEPLESKAAATLYRYVDREYAYVDTGDELVPCLASGSGGDLLVKCATDGPGELIVQENSWNGWQAWVDGTRASLRTGDWLSVEAPAGEHEYRFLYRPWDVNVGLILTGVGLILAVLLWRWAPGALQPEASQSEWLPPTTSARPQHDAPSAGSDASPSTD